MIVIKTHKVLGGLIILILIIFLIKIIPFYNYSFNEITQNNSQIITYSQISLNKTDAIIIIDGHIIQNIKINNGINYFPFNIEIGQKIFFSSKEIYDNTYIFLQLTGNIIKLYPQSAIYINNIGKNLNITIIKGLIQYLNLNETYKITFQGEIRPLEIDPKDISLSNILQNQKENQKKDIINLYGGNIILNKTFDNIIHKLIILLSKINPKNFKDNLQNYNNFKIYINNLNQNINLGNDINFKKNEKNNINNDILKQFNKGLSKILNTF